MSTVYDLLLNFCEIPYDFYEWNTKDDIEHIKKIPFAKVSSDVLYDFIYKDIKINVEFLNEIKKQTQKYDLTRLDYACIFTDGITAVAIEFNSDGSSIYKSKLQLEDEEEIIRFAKREIVTDISYEVVSDEEKLNFFTRKELKMRKYLEKEIMKIYNNKEYFKLEYLYLEYCDTLSENVEFIKDSLLDSIKYEINDGHYRIYEFLLLLSNKKKMNN